MKKRWIAVIAIASVIMAGAPIGYHTLAAGEESGKEDYDSQISGANEKKAQYEKLSKQLESEIKELEKNKGNLESYMKKLDDKMDTITKQVSEVNKKVEKEKAKLATVQKELNEAQKQEDAQYTSMKKRIKYMYENGSGDYLDMIFSAKDLGDLLSRSEYVQKITDYDSNMFVRFRNTKRQIAKKQEIINTSIRELNAMSQEAEAEQDALNTLSEKKERQLAAYKASITSSTSQKERYDAEMEKQEAIIESALESKRKKVEEAAKNPSNNNTGIDLYKGKVGKFRWPLQVSGRISSTFGPRKSPTKGASTYHKGIDIAVPSGTPIVAVADGSVVTAMYSSSAGNYIMLYHGSSTYTVYMHCSKLAVSEGDKVKKGQVIGYVGSTGYSTGPHLHFGVSVNGGYVNPLNYVSR